MTRRSWVLAWCVLLGFSAGWAGAETRTLAKAAGRPNILFLFTDDQAPWALGLSGHPHARTPALDKLFREGAWLQNCFTTTPVCSPSRAALMTGRYGSELGITDWLHPRREGQHGLLPGTITWPRLLQQAGYRTGLIGKWHLGLLDRHHPTRFGYADFYGFRSGGTRPKDAVLEVDGRTRRVPGLLPDVLVDEAIRFLGRQDNRPFLLSLHFRAPHAPWLPVAEADLAPFKDLDPTLPHPDFPGLDIPRVKRMTREYLASTASVDRNVGRLLEELKRRELEQNTIVIFNSDHGYNMGHNGIWHKGNGHWVLKPPPPATRNIPRGQRPNMYDQSLRVPTAVRWPGVIKPGTILKQTITNLDFFPTILAMTGVEMPGGCRQRGRNFLPLLKGQATEWENDLFAQYDTQHQSWTAMRMYRTKKWKLVRDFRNPHRDELFDLVTDPGETTNLLRKPGAAHAIGWALELKMIEKMKEIDDPALALVPGSLPLQVVGHRGMPERAPENTLAAFAACVQLGVGFEVDIRRTSDGQLVCLHDATLDRTTDGKGPLADVTLEELRKLDAGGWFAPSFRGQRVPTVEEMFAQLNKQRGGHWVVAIDLKGADKKIEADVVAAAQRHGVLDRLLFIGRAIADPEVRARLRRAARNTHVACLANGPEHLHAAINDRDSDWVYIRFVPAPVEVRRAHDAGKRVFLVGKTVARRQPENWQAAGKASVDAILTDFPLELQQVLAKDPDRTDDDKPGE